MPTPDQPVRVRVVCPRCSGTKKAHRDEESCGYCWHIDEDEPRGTILAALADPEVAARLELGDAAFAWLMLRGDSGKPFWTGPEMQRVLAAVEAIRAAPPPPEPRPDGGEG